MNIQQAIPSTTGLAFLTPSTLITTSLTSSSRHISLSTSRKSREASRINHNNTQSTTTRRQRSSPIPEMTLSPKDCSWKSERDLRAIESEFYVQLMSSTNVVDDNMNRLRKRISVLDRKEKQWSDFCQQFASLSVLTGIPMVNPDTGDPSATAWIFLSLSSALPLYILSVLAQLLSTSSASLHSSSLF